MRFGDKYKFAISFDGTIYKYVTLAKTITITGELEEKTYRFNKKSSVWRILRYENLDVYTELLAKVASPSTIVTRIKCRVELYDDFTTFTEYSFEGYISIEKINIDEDGGIIEFTPEEDSSYAWYDEHKSDRKDIISSENSTLHANTLYIDDKSVLKEYWVPYNLDNETLKNLTLIDHSDDDDNGATIQHWSSIMSYAGDPNFEHWWKQGWVVHTDETWKFYYCIKSHDAAIASTEPGVGAYWRKYWIQVDEFNRYQNAVYHVGQQISTYPLPDFVLGDGIFQPPFYMGSGTDLSATNCPANYYCKGSLTVVDDVATLLTNGNVKLSDAINYLLDGSGLTFGSDFFTSSTNPVTGRANHINYLRLASVAFLKNINDSSTTGEVSLEELLNDLCNTFNCLWYITGTTLKIEHISYFESGGSYGGTQLVYTDLTNTTTYPYKWQIISEIDGSGSDKQYSYVSQLPQKEIFHFNDGYDYDGEIWYDSAFAKIGEKTTRNISTYIVDLAYIFYNRANSVDDGFCLVACDAAGNVLRRDTGLKWRKNATEDVYTGLHGSPRGFTNRLDISLYGKEQSYPNGDLQWHNLLTEFWVYSVYFLQGRINNQASPTTFTTQKRIKKQREIKFPRLESGAFNPYALITTNLGDGEVSEYEIDTDTDFIKVTLMY